MAKDDDMCYYERLKKYEADKFRWVKEHPIHTPKEYDKAIKKFAKKWSV